MTTEIELKFLLKASSKPAQTIITINELLSAKKIAYIASEQQLTNHYFDTSDLNFRKYDMGLRVRTCHSIDKQYREQTIKTSGKVQGGLHQRPEYNVSIKNTLPVLSLFPSEIWHEDQNVEQLQAQLITLFSTDFLRTVWTITLPQEKNITENSVIELVFDQGKVESNGLHEDICELELELVSGSLDDLLMIADQLSQCLKVRLGQKSKAARGYGLWHMSSASEPGKVAEKQESTQSASPTLALIPLSHGENINHAFVSGINFSLNKLQQYVDAYIDHPSLTTLTKITEILTLIRHGFWVFDQYLPVELRSIREQLSSFIKLFDWVEDAVHLKELLTKTGNYRAKLHYSEQLTTQLKVEKSRFPNSEQVSELFHSTGFTQIQLALIELLLQENVLIEVDEVTGNYPDLVTFSSQALDNSLDNLVAVMARDKVLNRETYLVNHTVLVRTLLTGSWFGSLYNKDDRLTFRNPWLDTQQGISELQTLLLLQKQLSVLTEPLKKLTDWLDSKVEHLLETLHQSKEQALSLMPYWRS
jgi:triphosphatase